MPRNEIVNYIHFDSLSSTNTWAKDHAACFDPQKITCITASEQTAGRGRLARSWFSPKGLNLYATLYFCLPSSSSFVKNLAQLLSISCARALASSGFSPSLKWPNDLLLEGKKVGGVLCETIALKEELGVCLGIGLNVNMPQLLLDKINQPATSLKEISQREWDLSFLLSSLLDFFVIDLDTLKLEGFAGLRSYYESLLSTKDQPITWIEGERSFQGICKGISDEGALRLLLPSGQEIELFSGETISWKKTSIG